MKTKRMAMAMAVVLGMGSVMAATVFDVREYGAKGDGLTLDTAAIQAAVDAAAKAGGGEVFVGPGSYVSGSIFLKSNVDFHVGPGATILASTDRKDYNALDVCPQNRECKSESSFGAHLFLCIEQRNVTLRGPGCIDGRARAFIAPPGSDRKYDQDKIPWRPSQMLFFCESQDIRIRDLELKHASYWSCFLHGCQRAVLSGLYVHTLKKPYTHNGDGIDIDCCEYVSVSDCLVDGTDDCITLRGSAKPLRTPRDCAHVTIANCQLSSMCNAVRFGVGNGRIHDIVLTNLAVFNSRIAFNFVSSWSAASRGTDIYNVRIFNCTVECYNRFLWMYPHCVSEAKMHDIYVEGVSGTAKLPATIVAQATNPFERIHLRNVDVTGGLIAENVNGLEVTGGSLRRYTPEEVEAMKKAGRNIYSIW